MRHIFSFIFLLTIIASCNHNDQTLQDQKIISQAKILIDSNKYQEAIDTLRKIVDKSYEAKYFTGIAYRKLKQSDSAESKLREVYNIKPDHRQTCYVLTLCLLDQIDLNKPSNPKTITMQAEGIKLLTEGLKYKKDSLSNEILANYYAIRGQLLQLQGKFNLAINDLDNAIRLDSIGDYYTRRAITYHFMGMDSLACKDFSKGQQLGQVYNESEIKKICR